MLTDDMTPKAWELLFKYCEKTGENQMQVLAMLTEARASCAIEGIYASMEGVLEKMIKETK